MQSYKSEASWMMNVGIGNSAIQSYLLTRFYLLFSRICNESGTYHGPSLLTYPRNVLFQTGMFIGLT